MARTCAQVDGLWIDGNDEWEWADVAEVGPVPPSQPVPGCWRRGVQGANAEDGEVESSIDEIAPRERAKMAPTRSLPYLRRDAADNGGPLHIAAVWASPQKPWVIHDMVNLGALSLATALIFRALLLHGDRLKSQRQLSWFMLTYMAIDSLWISVMPEIVRAPAMLLAHHAATCVLLVYALAEPSLLHYVPKLSLVELNTLSLIARRHLKHWVTEAVFASTWVALRIVWFPCVALHLCLFAPVRLRHNPKHVAVVISCGGLALQQLVWTRDALKSMRRKWNLRMKH